MWDESKDNAPDREASKGRLATFVDQVEDEHLVQVQDHPDFSESWICVKTFGIVVRTFWLKKVAIVKTQARNWIENLPRQTADEESGDDGDEDQGEPLLSSSSSSTLPHLRKHQLAYISIPFPDSFCDPLWYFIFWSAHRKEDPEVEAAYSRERKNPNHCHSQPVVVVRDVGLCQIKIHTHVS